MKAVICCVLLLIVAVAATSSHGHHHGPNHDLRVRRDLDALIDKHLKWLSDEQKQVIRQMRKDGASLTQLKTKLMSFINDGSKAKLASCDSWFAEVTSSEERYYLKELSGLDRTLCRRRLREFAGRLPAADKSKALASIDGCLKDICGTGSEAKQKTRT